MNEAILIQKAQAGDVNAFTRLIDHYEASLRGTVAFYVSDYDAVLDILQDALFDAWQRLDQFDAQRPFEPWIRAVCRNRARMHLRSQARSPGQMIVDEALLAAQPVYRDGRIDALRLCLGELDSSRGELLEERFISGARIQDLAKQSGKSPNSISMRLVRIKDLLRSCIEQRMEQA